MERIQRNGGDIDICPPCADWIGANDEKIPVGPAPAGRRSSP